MGLRTVPLPTVPEYVLKLNVDMSSEACRRKVLKVLSCINIDTDCIIVDQKGLTHINQESVDINVVLHTLAESGYKAELVDIVARAGYQGMVVGTDTTKVKLPASIPTPWFGYHRVHEKEPYDSDPLLFSDANYSLHSRNELSGSYDNNDSRIGGGYYDYNDGGYDYNDSRIGNGYYDYIYGRIGGGYYDYNDSRIGYTHQHHRLRRNGCALDHHHGINQCHRPLPPCHHNSRIGCTYNYCHGRNRCGIHHHQQCVNYCHQPLPPCHHDNQIGCIHHHHCHGRIGCALQHHY